MNFNRFIDWDGVPKYRKAKKVRKHVYIDYAVTTGLPVDGMCRATIHQKCTRCGHLKSYTTEMTQGEVDSLRNAIGRRSQWAFFCVNSKRKCEE